MNSLLLSILAALSGDFLIPNVKTKDGNFKLSGFLWHGLSVFLLLILFLHGYQWPILVGYATILTLIHLVIDFQVGLINRIKNNGLNLAAFIIQQILHLISICIVWSWFDLQVNPAVLSFYDNVVQVKALPSLTGITNGVPKIIPARFLLGAIFYIYICFGGSDLIEKYLIWLRKQEETIENKVDYAGKWIGILERLIVLSLMLNNALGSVAFILTAKSIARFSELHNRDFAEYYLIGTLASTTLAICGGFILNFLFSII